MQRSRVAIEPLAPDISICIRCRAAESLPCSEAVDRLERNEVEFDVLLISVRFQRHQLRIVCSQDTSPPLTPANKVVVSGRLAECPDIGPARRTMISTAASIRPSTGRLPSRVPSSVRPPLRESPQLPSGSLRSVLRIAPRFPQ